MTAWRLFLLAACVSLPACAGDVDVLDHPDASHDAGTGPDASGADAGAAHPDGALDSAITDEGVDSAVDAGIDSGTDDGGLGDGGLGDGALDDGGLDGGAVLDGGDAGAADAGTPDGGVDAAADGAGSTCGDGMRNGDETGPDCGGSCTPCGLGVRCGADYDCISSACDAVSLTCVTSQCDDRRIDGMETDADCGGGACPVCATGSHCLEDRDCTTDACDVPTRMCVTDQCADHRTDGLETAVDCGGITCSGCANGDACIVPTDCASTFCDFIARRCVASSCMDHRMNVLETDIDCGGGSCPACNVGQHCLTNFDCVSGHFCNGIHVCQ